MRVAAIQYDVQMGNIKENSLRAAELLHQAAANGAELVLLPELWNCGYLLSKLDRLAESSTGPSISMLREIAAKENIFIVGGSIAEKKGNDFYNTSFAIDNNGNIAQKYRKAHLFSHGLMEHQYFKAGNEWGFCEFKDIKIGMTICYDLRFPEFIRNLTLRGAQIITVPAEWPLSRLREWRILCKARAVENSCFVISANATDTKEKIYPGSSMIISPIGEVLAELDNRQGVICADLDFSICDEVKRKISVYDDRRRILDEIDDSQI